MASDPYPLDGSNSYPRAILFVVDICHEVVAILAYG